MKKRVNAALAALLMLATCIGCPVIAEKADTDAPGAVGSAEAEDNAGDYRAISYEEYLEEHSDAQRPAGPIDVPVSTAAGSGGCTVADAYGRAGVLLTEASGAATLRFSVPESGLYDLRITYYPTPGKGTTIERSLLLDGELPFEEARSITLRRIWRDAGEKRYDSEGNEFRRAQEEAPDWIDWTVVNEASYLDAPLGFYLSAGEHTLTIRSVNEPMAIAAVTFCQTESAPAYADALAAWRSAGYTEASASAGRIQGEDTLRKSSASIYGSADRSSPADEPFSLTKTVLNTIGGTNWQYTGDWIEWRVTTDAPGLYQLAIRAKQNFRSGSISTRSLHINGKTPFAEAAQLAFRYEKDWQMFVPADEDGTPYLFYLPAGENTVRLQVVTGDLSAVLRSISASVSALSGAATKITMLTGSFPDPLRDYELKKTLPEVFTIFSEQIEVLERVNAQLADSAGGKGEQSVTIDKLLIQLERFIEEPRIIPTTLSAFKDNISSLSAWLLTVSDQPLQIDWLEFLPPSAAVPAADVSFWARLVSECKAFFLSFISNYNTIADMGDGSGEAGSVELWLAGNSGRDQAVSIKSLADNYFSPQTGIRLDLRLVDMDVLLRAVSADEGPDIAIFQDQATPVNYALRSALQDLSVFPDVEEVRQRFAPSALVPLTLGDALYGLPEQQTFLMLFYRKDILHDLGLSVPQTWQDFYAMIPVLQSNNLRIGLPSPITTTSGGMATQLNSLFNALLYQNGLEIYSDDRSRCLLDEPAAIEVFTQWSELYTKYKLDKTLNETDYFRTGEAPIVLSTYTLYNTLSVSAPEIRDLWSMAPVPGIRQEDGQIRRDVGSAVTSVIMFGNAKDKDACWSYMKWWTSADAQTLYGREIEALQGISARYPTANLEAMSRLPWPTEIAEALNTQWKSVRGVPEVAGGYYVGRSVDNAIKSVINENKNAREVLLDQVEDIDREIAVKRREFGLE